MLYLEFYHITDLGAYLQEKGLREAFWYIMAEGSTQNACRRITFSARVGDHIAISTFSFQPSEDMSEKDADFEVNSRLTNLVNHLKYMGISGTEGRWTDKTPIGLTDDLSVERVLEKL